MGQEDLEDRVGPAGGGQKCIVLSCFKLDDKSNCSENCESIYWVYQGSLALATLPREVPHRSFDEVHP